MGRKTSGSQADGVRDRILAAAKVEFAEKGFAGASVRAIGSRAGVTAAMINYYFRGKKALYSGVLEEAMGELISRLQRAFGESGGAGIASKLAGAYFDYLSEERSLQRLLMREILDRGEGVEELGAYLAPLRGILEDAVGEGDRYFHMAISLFGAVAGYFLYEPVLAEILHEDPMSKERLARRRKHIIELAERMALD